MRRLYESFCEALKALRDALASAWFGVSGPVDDPLCDLCELLDDGLTRSVGFLWGAR